MSYYAGGNPTNGNWNVQAKWAVTATREIGLPAMQLEAYIADAIEEASGARPEAETPRRWVAKVRRRLSVFDVCTVVVTLDDANDGAGSVVRIEVDYDSSDNQIGVVVGLTTSIVGAPLAWGWRWHSVRDSRGRAKAIVDAVLAALARHTSGHAYR